MILLLFYLFLSIKQRDGKNVIMDSSDSEDEDAFVPHQHPNILDDEFNVNTPIRVPSAPARMASSPSPSPSPSLVSLQVRTTSPSPTPSPTYASSTGKRSPTSPSSFMAPSTPPPFSTSPTARVPAFTQAPPSHACVPTPHLVAADDFDAKFGHDGAIFGNRNGADDSAFGNRTRSDLDHFGIGKVHVDSHVDSDTEPDAMETDEIVHQKKSGLFSFGSNKPMVC